MNIKSITFGVLFGFQSLLCHAAYVGIHAAASRGDVPKLKEYLADNPQLLSSRNGPNRTPLCIAAMCGQPEAVEFLIAQGADVNDKGFQEMTPLADMASPWGLRDDKKCAEIASVLIAHGAKMEAVDVYGKTPLLWAAEAGKTQLVRVLLEKGADANIRSLKGPERLQSPLHLAVAGKHKEMVEVLLKFNASLDAEDSNGTTPLNVAEGLDNTEIADLLRAAAQPPSQDPLVKTPNPPTKKVMRALAKRVAEGDAAAFDELTNVAAELYRGIKDYEKERPRVMLNLSRMKAAFDLLGEETGKGNEKAFQALKKSLGVRHLQAFAPDALKIASAAGHKGSIDTLHPFE